MSEQQRIVCIGAGYVGGPTMSVLASKCEHIMVTVVDLSVERIAQWNSDELPIYEPGLVEIVTSARGRNLFFSTAVDEEIAKADIIFVAVNTPTKTHGMGAGTASNIKNVELCARNIARCARGSVIVVEKSTVPVQTADSISRILAANCGDSGATFQVLSNPEFLAEGTAVADLLAPSRVLIGGAQDAAGLAAIETLVEVYANWVPRDAIIATNVWSSELSKLVANAYLAQRISSINSISALCEASNADVDEVARAVGSDVRIGPHFLRASVGFGGSCFQKDILNLVYLCESFGLREVASYWRAVVEMNEWQKSRFASKIVKKMFNTVTGKKICMLGFAFKKDTGDCRETAAAYIAKYLLEERAHVVVYDPQVDADSLFRELNYTLGINETTMPDLHSMITLVDSPYVACEGAHAIALMTEWDEFKTLDYARIYTSMVKPAFVFDGRNILDHASLIDLGFDVSAIGKHLAGKGVLNAGPAGPGIGVGSRVGSGSTQGIWAAPF